jgi:3-methylcrotonyl-CoA carboxylase alpha subunit
LFNYRARVETAVEEGDRVSSFYDPMIAKIICKGTDREDARQQLLRWLNSSFVGPVRTNKSFLYRCLSLESFARGDVDTGLIGRTGEVLTEKPEPTSHALAAAGERFRRDWLDDTPWDQRTFRDGVFGFRLNAPANLSVDLFIEGRHFTAAATTKSVHDGLCSDRERDGTIVVTERGHSFFFRTVPDAVSTVTAAGDGAITSPMPGRIIAVEVVTGASVAKGQKLVTLEAMKMEHTLTAPFDGVVAELNATPGAQVSEGTLLVRVEASGNKH